jgi:hypothetical protein
MGEDGTVQGIRYRTVAGRGLQLVPRGCARR